MSITTLNTQTITNLRVTFDPNRFVDQRELNNVVGAFLNDTAIILTTQYNIKTVARRANDESFNLQDFANTADYQLLITYFSSDYNNCKSKHFEVEYDIFYRIEGVQNNKSKLEEVLGIVNQLLCHNSNQDNTIGNSNFWTYQLGKKLFKLWLWNINQLQSQNLIYQKVQETNYYLAKQTYKLQISYSII